MVIANDGYVVCAADRERYGATEIQAPIEKKPKSD
jgi:hypothetical protein